jgi:hypothetical protein
MNIRVGALVQSILVAFSPFKVQHELHAETLWARTATALAATKQLDGQIMFGFAENRVKPQNKKYFALSEVKTRLYKLHPVPTRGALAIATNAGRVAMDVEAPWRTA